MAALPHKQWTVDEYLAFERDHEERHELVDGQVYAMTGTSRNHNRIQRNTLISLTNQFRNSPCESFPSSLRIKIGQNYTYPDVSVVCGEQQIETHILETLLNPTIIIEILSPSTEKYDRSKKFDLYRSLDSLQEYILISQDEYRIERYWRRDGEWLFAVAVGVDAILDLTSIGCTLKLADVYEKVTFEETE